MRISRVSITARVEHKSALSSKLAEFDGNASQRFEVLAPNDNQDVTMTLLGIDAALIGDVPQVCLL